MLNNCSEIPGNPEMHKFQPSTGKMQAVTSMELISKPFTNILEIPLFPWNAAQLWFLLRILFTPLNADEPISAESSVPEEAGNWGRDSNDSEWIVCWIVK